MRSMLQGLVALVFAVLAAATGGVASAAPPPVEHYTEQPAIDNVQLSPSGQRMAFLIAGPGGWRKLAVMSLAPLGKPRVVVAFNDADVTSVRWINEDRLVYDVSRRGALLHARDAGTFAVNQDGTQDRLLIAFENVFARSAPTIELRVLNHEWRLHSVAGDGSGDVFVVKPQVDDRKNLTGVQLARLDTFNGQLRNTSFGMPAGTQHWILDAEDRPRFVTAYVDGRLKAYMRDLAQERWVEIADDDANAGGEFNPLYVEPDGSMLVTARGARDTSALHRYDPVTRRVAAEPLIAVAGFDLSGRAETEGVRGRVLGVHFTADRPMSYWFDPRLDRIQRAIDAALPAGRFNQLLCGRCADSRFFVVLSKSDRDPGHYHLFDAEKSSIESIGASRPWLDAAAQGTRSFHRVTTRDGIAMPVYVTHPAGASPTQPLPTVVLVHGGPYLRGSDLGWQAEAQFLASRGYRVLQPEFRGSTGYGFRLFRAGWKQWGRAMQDDLIDALDWAVKQGGVDPARVCVMGGSYGGYAALMAPITHPDRFRCAVSFAGVTDLGLLYTADWSDSSEAARRYSLPVLVGDRVKDAAQLAAASPLQRAAEIKVPVLLGHGELDRRVPVEHARRFVQAARAATVPIQYVEYPDAAHGFAVPTTAADWLRRVEQFLEKSLSAR